MGIRFRRSKKILPGVRLNLNKDSIGLSFGVRGLRYTINSKGRRTATIGIPGTGISYSTTQNRKKHPESTVKDNQPEVNTEEKPAFMPICEISKRSSIGPSILAGIMMLWVAITMLLDPTFGNSILFALAVSAVALLLRIRDIVKTAKRVVQVHPEVADGPLESLAAENAVLLVYSGKTWRSVCIALCAIGFLAYMYAASSTKDSGYAGFAAVMLVYAGLTIHGLYKINRAKHIALEHLEQNK